MSRLHRIILIREKHVENYLVICAWLTSARKSYQNCFVAQHKGDLQDVAFDGQTLYSFNDLGDVRLIDRNLKGKYETFDIVGS